MKVVFLVTHLLGTGHLTRALNLARAFAAAGHAPTVISGGMPLPLADQAAVELVQLSPVRSDGTQFSRLLNDAGNPADAALHAARRDAIGATLARIEPDVLITELFPFGRRVLKEEFQFALDSARQLHTPPAIFASVRDILAPPSKPSKAEFAEVMVRDHYDAVLVHADPSVTPLELSWPVSPQLASKLRYTGFVAPPPAPPHPENAGAGEIIVSAGGGNVGNAVFDTAKAAARLDPTRRWRLLIGGQNAVASCAALNEDAPELFVAEPARPDFRQMLHHAAASVSLCGYNTALDILQTTCPAVFVPFDEGQEVEQTLRAGALAKQPGIEMLKTADLSAERLLEAVEQAQAHPRLKIDDDLLRGAQRTVEIVAAERIRHGR